MIIDRRECLANYQAILRNIDKALSKVSEVENTWEEGVRYLFDGGFVFFQQGKTKPLNESQFEAHKKYVDVQLVLEGSEYVAINVREEVSMLIPYDNEKDVEKYQGETEHFIKVSKGMGYVCFPWDIHKAIFHIEKPQEFIKAVIKIEI
ncbi:YhcH/YjgK/YiaL family protein [Streptococcus thoraltensis]|uniref:YhcH/YjgK/YiaL family protein n=1 Tax=Streptococcus thoraltensis TaxID=55085 RepID=UPI0003647434|nr:YhcH/YjgK/YiaL family protein [Streptococcus thoraltensis]MDY4761511.1 YhcH/YjgK/YiaL family protein [Streptococcus thoraltensis]